ncbi:hypothetical protein DSBG_0930 [Desulfosporosinus sp. BG]|nr:hypothetical protein DSBG_0930 [Desulfosporosinus sp. BG]
MSGKENLAGAKLAQAAALVALMLQKVCNEVILSVIVQITQKSPSQ